MTQHQTSIDTVKLAREVQSLYLSHGEGKTFGAWVLDTFYPQHLGEPFGAYRDFYRAERTTDARYYLGGMLASGTLSPEPLLRAVQFAKLEIAPASAA
jgi:hypothetical protein